MDREAETTERERVAGRVPALRAAAILAAAACQDATGSPPDMAALDMGLAADQGADGASDAGEVGDAGDGGDAGDAGDAGVPLPCNSPPLSLYEALAADPRVALWGTLAIYADGAGHIVDLSDPTEPDSLLPGSGGVAPLGPALYVPGTDVWYMRSEVLFVIQAYPSSPILVGEVEIGGGCVMEDIFVEGSVAYLACRGFGLHLIDISDPDVPVEAGSTDFFAWRVWADGGIAYVTDRDDPGLWIVDATDPASPAVLARFDSDYEAGDVEVAAGRAYLTDDVELKVLDVSDPSAPALLAAVPTPAMSRALALRGDLAYIAAGSNGVAVVDVSDLDAPSTVGSFVTKGEAMDVAVNESLLIVGERYVGFEVFPACPDE